MTDLLDPRNCACFNLRRAARRITQAYDRALRPAGIQAAQFTILTMTDAGAQEDGMTVSELAERLGMDRTTLSRNLDVVERRGWIETRPGADRRERLAILTAKGRAMLAEALPLWTAAQQAAIRTIGEESLADLTKLSRQIAAI